MKDENNNMKCCATGFGYDYYIGKDAGGNVYYNIVPLDHPMPSAGYYDKKYILKIKNVPDLFGNLILNQ